MIRRGPWSDHEIERFLEQTRVPIRLACNGASGSPVLASLWFLPLDGRLWCATQQGASVGRHLARDPRCAFEVAEETAPYRGVRGQGSAILHPERGAAILQRLVGRYVRDPQSEFARWLLERAESETAIAIEPHRLFSWDYRKRMGVAV
jgi:hypothetical protein